MKLPKVQLYGEKEIYLLGRELTKENIDCFEGSYLYLRIKIVHKKLNIQLYDKRDNFVFSIIRMPYPAGNISSEMFYSAFGAEIFRTVRTTSDFEKFCRISENLISRMLKQGVDINVFTKALTKIYVSHFKTFRKFYDTSKEFIDSFIK